MVHGVLEALDGAQEHRSLPHEPHHPLQVFLAYRLHRLSAPARSHVETDVLLHALVLLEGVEEPRATEQCELVVVKKRVIQDRLQQRPPCLVGPLVMHVAEVAQDKVDRISGNREELVAGLNGQQLHLPPPLAQLLAAGVRGDHERVRLEARVPHVVLPHPAEVPAALGAHPDHGPPVQLHEGTPTLRVVAVLGPQHHAKVPGARLRKQQRDNSRAPYPLRVKGRYASQGACDRGEIQVVHHRSDELTSLPARHRLLPRLTA
mmetsp:Transcript_87643/g.253112  ORF Transcript_87643/g.253112 Transcript_87643/m.253112 type:complete len:262 (+) Transcript_87643:390-1175(+)